MPRIAKRSTLTSLFPRQLALPLLALGLVGSAAGLAGARSQDFVLVPGLVFTSTRDNPYGIGSGTVQEQVFAASDIYLWLTRDGSEAPEQRQVIRLTDNQVGDALTIIDPTGRKVVFDSIRARAPGEPLQISDLFVMDLGDYDETLRRIPDHKHAHLTRGSSAMWSPDGKSITFHASASGVYTAETMARPDPGTPMLDSDIFVLNVDDCIAHADECLAKEKAGEPGVLPEFMKNITKMHGPASIIDEDPDWSPDGSAIVFTRYDGEAADHNNTHGEIFLIDPAGVGPLVQVTHNAEEERAPQWSPDGTKIVYMCRRTTPPGLPGQFQVCVTAKDGQGTWVETKLTSSGQHLGARWSADGDHIVFHRPVPNPDPLAPPPLFQLFRLTFEVRADGTYAGTNLTRLTDPPGFNGFPSWGRVRVRVNE